MAAIATGFCWAAIHAEIRQHETALSSQFEAKPINVKGVVDGVVESKSWGKRLRLQMDEHQTGLPAALMLNDYGRVHQAWRSGQRWQLTVTLKRPHGTQNPGNADLESWMFAEGIGATGTIDVHNRILLDEFVPMPLHWIDRIRENITTRLRAILEGDEYAGVVVALVVGDTSGISAAQWESFRLGGITHLVSISGLHITLVAGLVAAIVSWLWRRSVWLTLRFPPRYAAAWAGILAALVYSLLAGFSVPTQRTFFMVTATALALLSGRMLAVSLIWCLALGVAVMFDPWAVLSAGFWLSFGTVGIMLYAGSAGADAGWWSKIRAWGWAQFAATIGSMPLLLYWFQQMPLASPLANAIAIPMVGSVATPLALLGVLDPSGLILKLAHLIMALTFDLVSMLAPKVTVWEQASPSLGATLMALGAVACMLAPAGVKVRAIGASLMLPALFPVSGIPREGEAQVTVLDVGQGLSVLVQTAEHALLFDTGNITGGGSVLPGALRALGATELDRMILSHDDTDHVEAATIVTENTRVDAVAGIVPAHQPAMNRFDVHPCVRGDSWIWNGVKFSILHPDAKKQYRADNDSACVLKVASSGGSVLIPADIGVEQEAELIDFDAVALDSDILVMPHHGSRTSSSSEFIAAVSPALAIATVGYRNRYRHPRADIVARYRAKGVQVLRSDEAGAVAIHLGVDDWNANARRETGHYWNYFADRVGQAE